jgi:uncharacterized protein YciI
MFVISLNYQVSLDQVDRFRDEHIVFLKKYYTLNKFIVSGAKIPRTGGIILCRAESLDEVNRIVSEDPFFRNGIARYEITEFAPSLYAGEFGCFINR